VVYVSHRLEEVLSLADRITVMRDGSVVETDHRARYTIPDLIRKMVGREVDHLFHREPLSEPEQSVAFSVRDLHDNIELKRISFSVHRGEIFGIAGLPGSGKDELVDCLSGVRTCFGKMRLAGHPLRLGSSAERVARGLVLVPADRRGAGMFPVLSIVENIAAANLRRVTRCGVLQRRIMKTLASTYLGRMQLKASSIEQRAGTLSGGNQQKVVLARGLGTNPLVLLMHEPTRGIDVGAKAEIYQILNQLAAKGLAIMIVSSELPELIGQCDRIAVMHAGTLAGEFARTEFSQERILECAMGQNHEHVSC
jgi:ribose transport system ATP-binding protein